MLKKNHLFWFPLLLVFYELPTYLSNDAYLPALPIIVKDFLTTPHLVQLTLTAWFLGTAFMQLVLGPLADRYGRRLILLSGGIVFIISTIGCALAPNIWFLLTMRVIQGLTVTSMIVAGYATIHDLFDHDKAIHTLAWMYSISVLAPSAGPLLGAVVLYFAGWREIFWILALWAFIVIVGLWKQMPETAPKIPGSIHPVKIMREYKRMLFNFQYISPTLSFCLLFSTMIAWLSAGPFLVITAFHRSAFTFGLLQCFVFGGYIAGTRLIKLILKKYKTSHLLNLGLIVAFAGGGCALLLAWLRPQALIALVLSVMLIAISMGFCSPMLNRAAVEAAPDESMGNRIALYSCLTSLFGMLSSALITGIYNGRSLPLAFVLFASTLLALALNFLKQRGFKK